MTCLNSVSHPRNSHLRGNFFKINFLVKKRYYGNEGLSLAWDRIKVCQVALFITTSPDFITRENWQQIASSHILTMASWVYANSVITNFFEILKQTKFIHTPKNKIHEVLILKKSAPGTTIHNYF